MSRTRKASENADGTESSNGTTADGTATQPAVKIASTRYIGGIAVDGETRVVPSANRREDMVAMADWQQHGFRPVMVQVMLLFADGMIEIKSPSLLVAPKTLKPLLATRLVSYGKERFLGVEIY